MYISKLHNVQLPMSQNQKVPDPHLSSQDVATESAKKNEKKQ